MGKATKGWRVEDYYEALANQYLREHAQDPLAPTEREWLQAHTFDEKRLKRYALESANYNPNLVYNKFQRANPAWGISNVNEQWHGKQTPYSRPITTLDIETDDLGRPITISAVKSVFNKKTGQMEVVDTFQRFYKARDVNLRNTEATHGLTRDILNKFRRQQGADYSWTYAGWGPNKGKEQEALASFLGDSILVGHNIHDFDIPKLFGRRVKNQVVDTLMAARNIWGDTGENSLDKVFRRIFGKSMEEAGLPHHDSMSDTIATAMIYEAMATSKTPTGDALRKILRHGDLNLAPVDLNIDTDIGGSQLIRGPYWKYAERNIKDYIDRYGLTGGDYMGGDYKSAEELEGERLGTSVHISGDREKGTVDPSAGIPSDTALVTDALAKSVDRLGTWLQTIQQSATDIRGFGSAMSQYRKAQYIQLLARAEYDNAGFNSPGNMKKVARGLGIPDSEYEEFRVAATALKESKEYSDAYKELRHYTRKGLGDASFVKSLRASLADTWGDWGPEKQKALERDREYAAEMDFRKKDQFLRGQLRHGRITEEQYGDLAGLEGSYDDLVDATDEMIKKNQQLLQVYTAIGNIKMYDPNQYLNSARSQASGILGAARGVVPSFLLNPISRITDATFNYQQGKLAGFNAVSRTWNSGIGSAVTGVLGATMGTTGLGIGSAITGGINAASQIAGNIGQYRMEKAGFAMQNTLNTLGAAFSWISAPFQLLAKATKLLTGSFSGLSLTLNKIMTGGLTAMSAMGNPLTELTGVNYSAYQGTTMMDIASLFNKGSMNAAYENFANQQRAFYTTGEVNQGRLIAASMLGVYDKVYVPGTDTKTQYNSMVNQLLRNMKGQSADEQARTMYLASQIDSTLPGLLRTANMLGVTDINQLTNPGNRGMYFRGISSAEERRFRWDQYEYGAAQSQFSNIKMRFADKLWTSLGKELYNGFNKLADSALLGDWKNVIDEASNIWDTFKGKFTDVWASIKKELSGKGISADWSGKITSVFAKVGIAALEVVRTISNVWGQLVGIVMDKAQGLISYLSTISIKPHVTKDGFSFEIKTIKDQMSDYKLTDKIGSTTLVRKSPSDPLHYESEFKGVFGEVTEQLFPKLSETERARLTYGDVRKRLMDLTGTWWDKEGNLNNMLMIEGQAFAPDTEEAVDNLMGLLHVWGESARIRDAALYTTGSKYLRKSTEYSGNIPRMYEGTINKLYGEIVDPLIDAAQNALGDMTTQKVELNIKINDKDAADLSVSNGKVSVNEVRAMLSDMIHKNFSIRIAQQG